MISLRRVSLGAGYRYLMESVVLGDGTSRRPDSLAGYYSATGTPPGRFLGSGLAGLGDGQGIPVGSEVTEEHLFLMLGMCADPLTGKPVGRVPNTGSKVPAVAGFDLTFSPSKSVSILWALSDPQTRQVIYDCHRQAIDLVLAYGEEHVFVSRSGANGIVSEPIEGVIANAFTHFDSRAGDPQLHDHVIIWNRARSVSDGKWRTLDSRAIFQSRSAFSSLHQGVLADLLTQRLGVNWQSRPSRHSGRERWEITSVPEPLLKLFSTRAGQIDTAKDDLIERFVAEHGRQPTALEILRLRQTATLATRPAKTHRSLADMTETWRQQAAGYGTDWLASLGAEGSANVLRSDDVSEAMIADAATATLLALGDKRATYRRDNLVDEAQRILAGVRCATPADRIAVGERIADQALAGSLDLTPPPVAHTPQRYLRADGTSRLQARHLYTTPALLDAEARLLDAAVTTGAPTATKATVAQVTSAPLPGRQDRLSVDQGLAVEKVATSDRLVDVLVGPAGAGKSTIMGAVRAVWETDHGPGSVIGLAPSAAAAEVLAEELDAPTENTAKWLTEHKLLAERLAARTRMAANGAPPDTLRALDEQIDRWQLKAGQLVIVDEASLAGTITLDAIVTAAREAGAKVLLTGDWAQLSAVDAGGAFALLANQPGGSVVELGEIRRFAHRWEALASQQLRRGDPAAIHAYQRHGRITGGTRDELVEDLYNSWKTDIDTGQASLMIAADTATVDQLNRRAQADRQADGHVERSGVTAGGGQTIAAGDWVVTRHNDRQLTDARTWVKNGDRWTVTTTNPDGTITVQRSGGHGHVTLPADYVAAHVDLAYATTAYRSQGRTVDTTHTLIDTTTTREVLYVAATRGRDNNRLYVDTAYDPDPQTSHGQPPQTGPQNVLASVLANAGAEKSAHETIRDAQHDVETWATLAAEYHTLAMATQAQRWDNLLARSGLTLQQLQTVTGSDALGPLHTALRTAEAHHLDIETALPHLIGSRPLDDANDPAAVIACRVQRWTDRIARQARRHEPELIAGLIPRALNIADPEMSQALTERDQALQTRATHLAEQALLDQPPWIRHLRTPPKRPADTQKWIRALITVAAYRDHWDINNPNHPLASTESGGIGPDQDREHQVAAGAVGLAARLSQVDQHRASISIELIRSELTLNTTEGIDL